MTAQTQRWVSSPEFKTLLGKLHVDIYVGLKNHVGVNECKLALFELANELVNSVDWEPVPSGEVRVEKKLKAG